MGYQDITMNFAEEKKYMVILQKYYVDNKGIKHNVDGKYVIFSPTKREIEVAYLLGKLFGGKVILIPRINKPLGIKTPDYIINNEKFDLKEITGGGKYVIEGNLRKKKKQSNNFIIDLSNAKIDIKEAVKQVNSIYISKRFLWIDKIIIVCKDKILRIFRRK